MGEYAPRDRSRSTVTSPVSWTHHSELGTPQHGYTPVPDSPYTGTVTEESVSQTTEDAVTKDFLGKIAKGHIINNPFYSRKLTVTRPAPCTFDLVYRSTYAYNCSNGHPQQVHYTHGKEYGTRAFPDPGLHDMEELPQLLELRSDVINQAVTQAHANVDPSELLALASAAEGGKTVNSMLSIYSRLRKILRRLRRLQFSAVARELSASELQDRYMELRYAIRPLVYDAVGLAKALSSERGFVRKTYRGYAEDGFSISGTGGSYPLCFGIDINYDLEASVTVSCNAGVLCDVALNDVTVFGVDQIANTLWELAPFSFIVDWFVNVGDTIAANSPHAGVNQRASWATVKTTIVQKAIASGHTNNFGTYTPTTVVISSSASGGTFQREELVLHRIKNPRISTFPSVDLHLDVWKLIDMGIILRKMVRR